MKQRLGLALAIAFGVVVRVPFWAEALRTPVDGDTAIIGLMARHPGRELTMWGQPYGSPLDAWLAAPLVAAMGPSAEPLRLLYFLLGLALIPLAHQVAKRVDPRAALPAAALVACPPPYLLLLSALPPPLYATTLILCGLQLLLALDLGELLGADARPRWRLAAWGALAGLSLWTHLMSASVVVACAVFFARRTRRSRVGLLLFALVPLLAASAPWWLQALADPHALRVVRVTGRQETLAEHVGAVLPRLHRPLGGLLGTHVPVVADDPDSTVYAPGWAASALVLIYGGALIMAVRSTPHRRGRGLLLMAACLTLAAFPFPLRSGPDAIRFLTPLYLPVACLAVLGPLLAAGPRRVWIVVLALACLHLLGGARLLGAWRALDRASAPFLLPDLDPLRKALEAHGIRRAYASYGPAYRLTYESGERLLLSQPWNERFLHHPLPYLDEVRFAKNVAWVLTPAIPSDLPAPPEFETELGAAGGVWRRTDAGPAAIYHAFVPPFSPAVEPLPSAGAAGDGDPRTALAPSRSSATSFRVDPPRPVAVLTLVAGARGARLLRSMDVEVSSDGVVFEKVAERRRRQERHDLRWVNGHPQYVTDHDLIAIPLQDRPLAAVRIRPFASSDPWTLGEVLLHPPGPPQAWDEWLDPSLSWDERHAALAHDPRPAREDWYYRALLAMRQR